MTLVPIRSNSWVEIRFSSAPESQPWVKVGQSWQKYSNSLGLMLEHENCSFSVILTNFPFGQLKAVVRTYVIQC